MVARGVESARPRAAGDGRACRGSGPMRLGGADPLWTNRHNCVSSGSGHTSRICYNRSEVARCPPFLGSGPREWLTGRCRGRPDGVYPLWSSRNAHLCEQGRSRRYGRPWRLSTEQGFPAPTELPEAVRSDVRPEPQCPVFPLTVEGLPLGRAGWSDGACRAPRSNPTVCRGQPVGRARAWRPPVRVRGRGRHRGSIAVSPSIAADERAFTSDRNRRRGGTASLGCEISRTRGACPTGGFAQRFPADPRRDTAEA